MTANKPFTAGGTAIVPEGDVARQAVDALRGYAYQALAAALAWVDVGERDRLFLEVAEDYAVLAGQALSAVQVKDTDGSGSVTLGTPGVRSAVAAFVDLVERNPGASVELRYFTTSQIGTEHALTDRPAGMPGLLYWRKAAAIADPSPLRAILESEKFDDPVRAFVKARDDAALRRDLLGKIHWECGKPDISGLRKELEQRLIVVARDRFTLPAPDALPLADMLVYRVLQKSIAKNAQDRILTRADLYETVDSIARVSVPRAAIDALAQLSSTVVASLGQQTGPGKVLSTDDASWIIDSAGLTTPRGMIRRDALLTTATAALMRFGAGVLTGASGLGKSNISRAIMAEHFGAFSLIDFRDIDASETRRRLDSLLGQLGGFQTAALILDDLNHVDHAGVLLSLTRVLEALRRRDRPVLVTCYVKPAITTLAAAGLDHASVVECPYFSEEEARTLVAVNGGDAETWGRLAYAAAAGGHPQLTHAFVLGMASRSWPTEEIGLIVTQGLSSADINAAGDAARRNLPSTLHEGARNILYRLSIVGGRFKRTLALALAGIPPAIAQPGECIDQLVGPWLEAVGSNQYRVSPLVSTFGRDMLSPEEQGPVHQTIAVQMLGQQKVDASDADLILVHALAGKSTLSLAMIASAVLTADTRVLELLSEQLVLFPLLQTERPIYHDNPLVSITLRLAQFKLAAAAKDASNASEAAAALFREISTLPIGDHKPLLEVMALGSVLCTMGVANYLDDWIACLQRFRVLVEADSQFKALRTGVEAAVPSGSFFGSVFGIGSAGLASVKRLEHVIDDLGKLDASDRALWLTPIDAASSDYSVFINGPWAAEQRGEAFQASETAACYQRMAEKTHSWGIHPLAVQCWVARAVMLDEYEDNSEGALAVLDEAVKALGDDLALARARARIYLRRGQPSAALEILRGIADHVSANNPVERAFTLRQAAISAAQCSEWLLAEKWFLEAQTAATLAKTDDMRSMAVGLGADAAIAALTAGEARRGLTRLADALQELTIINPDVPLLGAYVHRAIRHAVLWAVSRIEGGNYKVRGRPVHAEAGSCSNPDFLPAVCEQPLGPIDAAWYLLAEAEAAAGLDLGIAAGLKDKLPQGPIPEMELVLRTTFLQACIAGLHADRFASQLWSYVEVVAYMASERARPRGEFNPLAPERGVIPTLAKDGHGDPAVQQTATDAVLAYCICAALAGRPEAIRELEGTLRPEFSDTLPGKSFFDRLEARPASLSELEQTVADVVGMLARGEHMDPYKFWEAGLRLFEWSNQSTFRQLLAARLVDWLRAGWKRSITEETFRLSRPMQTVPAIEAVLADAGNDSRFIAKLLLATADAVGASLSTAFKDSIQAMAADAPQPQATA